MPKWNRRDVLASLGVFGGAALLGGCREGLFAGPGGAGRGIDGLSLGAGTSASASQVFPAAGDPGSVMAPAWTYRPLDPAAVGQLAYEIYPRGSCMYAVVGSVILLLADEVGEPYRSFPLEMMRYGAQGIAGWGAMCGVPNGCAALIGLFHSEQGDPLRNRLISDAFLWYESSSLPRFQPAGSAGALPIGSAEPGSVLCHVSIARWCKATGHDAYSAERRERCRRLSADGAIQVARLLNSTSGNPLSVTHLEMNEQTRGCVACHGGSDRRDSMGMMSCNHCHGFDRVHP